MGTKDIDCVIIGAGGILDYKETSRRIPGGCFVICADGGVFHCEKLGVSPSLLVGDFDSAPVGELPDDVERVTLSPEKNYTDTDHALEAALARGFQHLLFCGVLGGRLDHTLANLQTLARCALRGIAASATDGVTDVYALHAPSSSGGSLRLAPRAGCYFSLLSMVDACDGVTILGGKYPLDDYPLSSLEARAVSNEFTGVPATITMRRGTLLAVVTPIR